jgi:rhodanese-related sulfurtransferase
MVETLSPQEARDIIARGEVDIIDVRDADEWTAGHIPDARLVPLDELRADPERALRRDSILFVCAKGLRSITAAKLAERLGFSKVFSLEGGTAGWSRAGLPLVAGEWAGDNI